jgi:hypothetical protein
MDVRLLLNAIQLLSLQKPPILKLKTWPKITFRFSANQEQQLSFSLAFFVDDNTVTFSNVKQVLFE